jgi:hypothetical protein
MSSTDVKIINYKNYKSSTITMVSGLNKTLKISTLAEYLPITHIFNTKTRKRVIMPPKTRDSIRFYGVNDIIISLCYKNIRRGVRNGRMNNMVCIDIQTMNKNVHVKLSEDSLTSVGTNSFEKGVNVTEKIIFHLNRLKRNIDKVKCLSYKKRNFIFKWLGKNCVSEGQLLRLEEVEKKIPSDMDRSILDIFLVYLDDFNKHEEEKYFEKISNMFVMDNIFEGTINYMDPKIYNSVFHIKFSKNTTIQLHKLALHLLEKGISVEFHNWKSEGVIVTFPIDKSNPLGSNDKGYKHRYTIHERGSMRQCSPSTKRESYKYYLVVITLLKKFLESGQRFDDFRDYIQEEK